MLGKWASVNSGTGKHCRARADKRFKPHIEEREQEELLPKGPDRVRPEVVKLRPIRIGRDRMSSEREGSGNGHRHRNTESQNGPPTGPGPDQSELLATVPAETKSHQEPDEPSNQQAMPQAAWGPHHSLQQGEDHTDFQSRSTLGRSLCIAQHCGVRRNRNGSTKAI